MENNELQHWGIKGQKWGQRRYQNKDGTLTPAGKKRYAKEMAKLREEKAILENKRKTQAKIDKLEATRREIEAMKSGKNSSDDDAPKKKSIKDMSDAELSAATARLQAEKNYRDAYNALNPQTVSRGKKLVDKLLDGAVDKGSSLAINLANDYIDDRVRKTLGLKKKDGKSASEKLKQDLEDAKNRKELDELNDKEYQKAKKDAAKAGYESAVRKNENEKKAQKKAEEEKQTETEKRTETEKETYSGTVVGEGTSKGSSKKSDNGPVVDVDFRDVEVSNVPAVYTSTGRDYVYDFLNRNK